MIRLNRIAVLIVGAGMAWALAGSSGAEKAAEKEKAARTDRYGDPLPPGAIRRLGTTRLRHFGSVTGLAFSPNQENLYSIGGDGCLRIWDVGTGKQLESAAVGRTPLCLALSADGKTLALGTDTAIKMR